MWKGAEKDVLITGFWMRSANFITSSLSSDKWMKKLGIMRDGEKWMPRKATNTFFFDQLPFSAVDPDFSLFSMLWCIRHHDKKEYFMKSLMALAMMDKHGGDEDLALLFKYIRGEGESPLKSSSVLAKELSDPISASEVRTCKLRPSDPGQGLPHMCSQKNGLEIDELANLIYNLVRKFRDRPNLPAFDSPEWEEAVNTVSRSAPDLIQAGGLRTISGGILLL